MPRGGRKPGAVNKDPVWRDLQWAYKHAHDHAKGTAAQEARRELYHKDIATFDALYVRHKQLAKMGVQKQSEEAQARVEVKDEGAALARDVLETLIRDFEVGEENGTSNGRSASGGTVGGIQDLRSPSCAVQRNNHRGLQGGPGGVPSEAGRGDS